MELAEKIGGFFKETSAKENYQVQDAFIQLTRDVIRNKDKSLEKSEKNITLNIGNSNDIVTKKKKCC